MLYHLTTPPHPLLWKICHCQVIAIIIYNDKNNTRKLKELTSNSAGSSVGFQDVGHDAATPERSDRVDAHLTTGWLFARLLSQTLVYI